MLLEEEGRMPNDEPMNHDGVDVGLQMWPNKCSQNLPIVHGVIVFSLQNVAKVDHVNTYHIQVIKLLYNIFGWISLFSWIHSKVSSLKNLNKKTFIVFQISSFFL
jgi:hypothetical protein